MSAYDNYSKPGYGGDDSGGFMNGSSQQGSQSGGYQNKNQTIRPVTIRQVINAEETFSGDVFKIDGTSIGEVTFVAQIRSLHPQATNVTIKVDDGTGQFDVRKWIDQAKETEITESDYPPYSYIRVWGVIKSFNNKRHLAAHIIRPVTDFNEVNYHLIEATYIHLYFTKPQLQGGGGANNEDSLFLGGGGGATNAGNMPTSKASNCSTNAQKLFAVLQNVPSNEGANVHVIASELKMSVGDVLKASDELLNQSIIYQTVDDETWAILEY